MGSFLQLFIRWFIFPVNTYFERLLVSRQFEGKEKISRKVLELMDLTVE